MTLQLAHAIRPTRGRHQVERDPEPTVAALRHAEGTAYIELSRAHTDLADAALDDAIAIADARRRIARHTGFWKLASEAYFAALAASIEETRHGTT